MISLSNDLGNSKIKGTINGKHFEVPSVIAPVRELDIVDPADIEDDGYFDTLLQNLDISVASSAVSTRGRFYFGDAAVRKSNNLVGFDINDYEGKSESDLSVILTLGLIAGNRVVEAHNDGEDLSETLKVDVDMTTALPISEAKVPGTRKRYKERYLGRSHTVTINNFVDPITVKINFKNVFVDFEGEPAHFYIQNADSALKKGIWQDFKEHYPEAAKEISVDDLISAPNSIHLDLGSKTADVLAVIDGNPMLNASLSSNQGYDYVLEDAILALQAKKIFFEDRIKLQSYLARPAGPLDRKRKARVEEIVKQQISPQVPQIVKTVSKAMNLAGADVSVAWVHGGASIPMSQYSDLREQLSEKLRQFTGGEDIFVIFIPAEDAPYCNERGLVMIDSIINKK